MKFKTVDNSFIMDAIKLLKNVEAAGPDKAKYQQKLSKVLMILCQSLCRWYPIHR